MQQGLQKACNEQTPLTYHDRWAWGRGHVKRGFSVSAAHTQTTGRGALKLFIAQLRADMALGPEGRQEGTLTTPPLNSVLQLMCDQERLIDFKFAMAP